MSGLRELTPRGRGGISVLELTGAGPQARFEALAGAHGDLAVPRVVQLRHAGESLDEALAWRRPDGALELHLHGSPVLVERLVELLEAESDAHGEGLGIEPRSLEAAARQALQTAPSEAAARCLLDQAEGALRGCLERIAADLTGGDVQAAAAAALELDELGQARRPLFEPARVVLAGPVNAGKSTLFNLLVGEQRVVVSEEEGTTRDRIEARTQLGAYAVDLVDTAGDRAATGAAAEVEARGQVAGLAERRAADLLLWLDPAGTAPPELGVPTVALQSRADQSPGPGARALPGAPSPQPIQALADPSGTLETLERCFHAALGLAGDPWSPGAGLPFDDRTRAACRRLADALLASDLPAAELELAALLA
ncbi:MAG: 50S ribosome-binding GTPase [Planctomycetota bacterium]|nr:50S ribosome-binding GTPase [Planctomycetota bacterium]